MSGNQPDVDTKDVDQIVAVLEQAEVGVRVAELIRQAGITEQTLYRWKKQYKRLETDHVPPAQATAGRECRS
jgi:transposase-like protein